MLASIQIADKVVCVAVCVVLGIGKQMCGLYFMWGLTVAVVMVDVTVTTLDEEVADGGRR